MCKTYSINNVAFKIGSFAVESMLYEISCFPSPGLVSPISSGAHNDMDYYTFIQSTSEIIKYMILFAEEGYSKNTAKEIFQSIREVGIEAENSMFKKTKEINTHKGMIFLLGIAVAATTKAIHDKKTFNDIRNIIKEMTCGIVKKELKNIDKSKKLTYGEKLYIEYGIEGIRGQVEKGLPLVFDYGLKIFKETYELSFNDRLIHTLIALMGRVDDSNILHRHSLEMLKDVNRQAKEIIELGGMRTLKGRERILSMEKEFVSLRISPGGCADLLAITVFFYLIEEYFKELGIEE